MCHPIPALATAQRQSVDTCAARTLDPAQRQQLAVQALAGAQTITQLARDHQVSRKFVYQQSAAAEQALHQTFADDESAADQVLFYLPVTKAWLRQLVLGLLLCCHSSFRGVVELLRDLLDFHLSVGTVHNIVAQAVALARRHNAAQDLSPIRIGAHDELFQNGQPVLVGADVCSTFCYLLSLEDQRDADTWGVRLLELQDRGFAPDATIADFGSGLRAGQKLALPQTSCRGDVFHALQEVLQVVSHLDNRAYQAIDARTKLERKNAAHQRRRGCAHRGHCQKLRHARPGEAQAIAVADAVTLLYRWLGADIFAVNGLCYSERRDLYDFVVQELRDRVPLCPQRLEPLCTFLTKHRDELLAFAAQLDQDLAHLAQEFEVPVRWVHAVLEVQTGAECDPRRWSVDAVWQQRLGSRYHGLKVALEQVQQQTVRASSVIENLNSRLRNYFFLRRHLGPDYLALLQFFLNHRRFLRSDHPDRVGKSPAELLTGQPHPHWLTMLGYPRFSRN
jgi:hypothetical protein